MPEVTVCIPAYRSAPFIGHTLASVQAQTFRDFEVRIAVEPVDDEATLAACAPYLEDPRFHAVVNDEQLRYAGNVRALLRRVRTPYFLTLPHDDAWHPRFLELLYDRLLQRPDAVLAYPDVLCHAPDGIGAGVLSHRVDDSELADRVVSWLLDGASGNIWHGLARSTVLDRDYPDNEFDGFAVECEWALHLLTKGRATRVAQPLYLKRQPSTLTPDSVSAGWVRAGQDLPRALDHHRRQLLSQIPDGLSDADQDILRRATEAAMLRRHQEFSDGRWGLTRQQLETAAELLDQAKDCEPSVAAGMEATVRWALSRHWEASGDSSTAEQEARAGLRAVPDDVRLCTQLGWLLVARDEPLEAVELGLRASRSHPDDPHVRLLLAQSEDKLEQRLRPPHEMAATSSSGPTEGGSEPGAPADEPDARHAAGMLLLYRRLRSQQAATQAAEERLMAAQTEADLLSAERDRLRSDNEVLDASLKNARTRLSVLAAQSYSARAKRALGKRRGALGRLGGPDPLFDAAWYRDTYPDVPAGPWRAWRQWKRRGWRDGRNPNPLFDTSWYLNRYPDVRASGLDPLTHYVLHGAAEGRDPGPSFDTSAYTERYPDVRASGLSPLLHYRLYGAVAGRRASPVDDGE